MLRRVERAFIAAGWPIYVTAFLTAVVVFAVGIVLDELLGLPNREVLVSDVFTAIVAGVLAYIAGRYYARERQAALDRLRVAAEVNHHVRNALTSVLYSVHLNRDPALVQITQDAVARIDWALREVLRDGDNTQQPRTPDAIRRDKSA
jgi:hypothetical protein